MWQSGGWLMLAVVATILIVGCTTTQPAPPTPDGVNTTMNNDSPAQQMELTSPAFEDGDRIPTKYGYTHDDINPPLNISDVPDAAESLVLIMDDPDAMEPAGQIWDHWVVYDITPTDQDVPADSVPAGGVEGKNSYGEQGYGGPNPPDREHTYYFRLYALDIELDLPANTSRDEVEDAMDGHVIAETELTGVFAPSQT